MSTAFNSDKVLCNHISEIDLCTYFIETDFDDSGNEFLRCNDLIEILQEVLLEFAFGINEASKISHTQIISKLSDAAKSIYKIKDFETIRQLYEDGKDIDAIKSTKKYLSRGEFGELILHMLLRDFHNTIPLLSKIYFKDSYSFAVHDFDAVHIEPETKSLWLGESKLYTDGKVGIKELINDILEHFKRDYLNDEFNIISKKIKSYNDIPEKQYWLNLMNKNTSLKDLLTSVTIPLLCVYTSDTYNQKDFLKEYEK